MTEPTVALEEGWMKRLAPVFQEPFMLELRTFLKSEKAAGKIIYPRTTNVFRALNETPFAQVRVVILGQDPYHGEGQAHGLSFSVPMGIAKPPSLQNIFKELSADLGIMPPSHGNLVGWARQGVLLLNSVLTVEHARPLSHSKRGWELFTDAVMHVLNDDPSPKVFILWGSYAQAKGAFIDRRRHLVIQSAHPSPLSAHRGFFGSKPFSQANTFLSRHGFVPIDWSAVGETAKIADTEGISY